MDSELFTVFLPLTLALMMMGLGLHLRPADFYRLTLHPKVIFIALFSQLVLLVGIAFLICQFLNLAPIFAIGLMLVAASPGGPTSNLLTYLFKGDVALNITLTATNSIISTLTLPFIINFSLMYFLQTSQPVDMPAMKMMKVFFITLLPVSMGMFLRLSSLYRSVCRIVWVVKNWHYLSAWQPCWQLVHQHLFRPNPKNYQVRCRLPLW